PDSGYSFCSLLPGNHFDGSGVNRLDDVLITGAAAKIAGNPETDVLLAGCRVVLEQAPGASNHAGRAETALKSVMFAESLLERMQAAVGLGERFDRPAVHRHLDVHLCHVILLSGRAGERFGNRAPHHDDPDLDAELPRSPPVDGGAHDRPCRLDRRAYRGFIEPRADESGAG